LTNVFFDLDGTLTHSHEGIVRCILHALSVCGAEPADGSEMLRFVGPPLRESFARLLGTVDDARLDEAMDAYRARFDTIGIFENVVCPGIPEALETLSKTGYRLFVVTAKPTVYARRILEHFELAACFEGVYGPDLSSRGYSKTSLVRDALDATGVAPASVAMVGDRGEDVLGARSNGVWAIAVSWGYGSQPELDAAGPDVIVDSAMELVEHLQRCRTALNARR
jgi:phosphoglycolate phosphatase